MGRPGALALTVLLAALPATVAVWPQGLGVAGRYGPAQVVAVRGLSTLAGLVALGGLLLTALLWRRARPYLLAIAGVVAAATALSATVVLSRGLGGDGDSALAAGNGAASDGDRAASDADVRVLAFNTLHDGVPAADLARLVTRHDADVVVLPETSRETTQNVADLSGAGFQVIHHTIDSITSTTGLLVSAELGVYGDPDPNPDGALASFTVWPETPGSPPITAVHTWPPAAGTMDRWRADAAWAVSRCTGSDGAIVAGDFNATLDHPSLRGLGPCVDAAAEHDAAAVGTWPAGWPTWAGAPIDHVVVDGRSWEVASFSVLDAVGGSDHRPMLAVLRRQPV